LRRAVAAGTLTGRRGEVWTAGLERSLVVVVGLRAAEFFEGGGSSVEASTSAVAAGALTGGASMGGGGVLRVGVHVLGIEDVDAARAGLERIL